MAGRKKKKKKRSSERPTDDVTKLPGNRNARKLMLALERDERRRRNRGRRR